MYFMVKSCIRTVRRPELHQNMPYLSSYHRPVSNSAKFSDNRNSPEMGKFRGSAQNCAFRGKLWSLVITRDHSFPFGSSQQWNTTPDLSVTCDPSKLSCCLQHIQAKWQQWC